MIFFYNHTSLNAVATSLSRPSSLISQSIPAGRGFLIVSSACSIARQEPETRICYL